MDNQNPFGLMLGYAVRPGQTVENQLEEIDSFIGFNPSLHLCAVIEPPQAGAIYLGDWQHTETNICLKPIPELFRYGSPGMHKRDWYLERIQVRDLHVILHILEQYSRKNYVAPDVMQLALNYLNTIISQDISYLILPHIDMLIQDVLYPLMCFPQNIQLKFDDFYQSRTAAQTVLHSIASRKEVVCFKTWNFCFEVITKPGVDLCKIDGAFHMIGTVAGLLLKKKVYKDQMEQMLVSTIFPEFQSPHGYMRARANWMVHSFSEFKFRSEPNLIQALILTYTCLVRDSDMFVRVESAVALQMLISNHDKGKELMQPQVREVVKALLVLIRETENGDLTNVMQKLICTYEDEIIPIAVDMTTHLADTFLKVGNPTTAMGILNTIETILNVVGDKVKITLELEPMILQVVGVVLRNHATDFYKAVFPLICSMTRIHVSPPLWEVFYYPFETFAADGFVESNRI